eukprot:scaffold172316_cov14-Tisochrysis_lutea.AAC.1
MVFLCWAWKDGFKAAKNRLLHAGGSCPSHWTCAMQETLDYVYKEIMSLWKAYKQQPFFGIDSEALAKAGSESMAAQHILSQ